MKQVKRYNFFWISLKKRWNLQQNLQLFTVYWPLAEKPWASVFFKGATGVKRGRAAPDSGAPAGKRRKKTSRSPYVGWSGRGPGDHGSLPLRIVTQVRTVLDFVKGSSQRPRNWMRSFPLIHGGDSRPGELILLVVPPQTKAKASHKAQPQPEPESQGED